MYNVAPYLHECLEQLHKQSCNSAEFIINDGSTDESKQICDEYQAIDSRFKVIHLPENQGLLRVRKLVLSIPQVDILSFWMVMIIYLLQNRLII